MTRPRLQKRIRGISEGAVAGARELRKRSTRAESILWRSLRGRRLDGLKFRRQYPVGPYILDFCCPQHRLVIELDGAHHDQQRVYDEARTEHLKQFGYYVLRFRNEEIVNDLDSVLQRITEAVRDSSASTTVGIEVDMNAASDTKTVR